jgi:xanthine dehydrogenase accessory factor
VEPSLRPEVVDAAGRTSGSVVVIPLPADAPDAAPGPRRPGSGETPAPAFGVAEDGTLRGSTGLPDADAAIVAAAGKVLAEGGSVTVAAAGRQFFLEGYPAPPRLVVVGGVQVAIPLVRLARELGYLTVVVDARAAFATRERFPEVDRLVVGWPDEVADEIGLGPGDAIAVLTHDVKFDEPAIITGLRRGCRYVGAVGSRRTQADRRARLRAAGVTDAELARLHGPIGLDLGGRAPAETALAIMAEVVAERHGGSGAPLRVLAETKATA